MTDTALAAPSFAEREFRVGSAISTTLTVLSRNVLTFGIVAGIASLPTVLLINSDDHVIRIGGYALSAGRGQGGVPGGVGGGRVRQAVFHRPGL